MTDDDVIALGHQARALLTAEPFMEALKGLMMEELNGMLHSDEGDAAGREKHFRSHRSLEAIAKVLAERTNAADVILERRRLEEQAAGDPINEFEDILKDY